LLLSTWIFIKSANDWWCIKLFVHDKSRKLPSQNYRNTLSSWPEPVEPLLSQSAILLACMGLLVEFIFESIYTIGWPFPV
jgi:hypothetical protein